MSLTMSAPFTIFDFPPLPSSILTFTTATATPTATATVSPTATASQERGHGSVLGGQPQSRRATPPQVEARTPGALDRTPSARAKVLPWVHGVQVEGYEPPEGMLGPYDSQPPSRPPTIYQPPPPPKNVHPFAYNAAATIPFSALAEEKLPSHLNRAARMGSVESHSERSVGKGGGRPESEVLSRGAGMRYLNQPQAAAPGGGTGNHRMSMGGTETPGLTGSRGSPGMGTFGREASMEQMRPQAKAQSVTSPTRKPVPAYSAPTVRQPPDDPLPPSPKNPARGGAKTHQPSANHPEPETAHEPHIHHPHHEYPFSHEEAARQQAEAMEAARAQTLAQLEAAQRNPALHSAQPIDQSQPAQKGPRETFDTTTSGPSFGHIMHQNGIPFPGRQSLRQGGPPQGAAAPPGIPGLGGNPPIMHIPFGVPIGASLPRPMVVMRNSAGVGLGIGIGGPRGVVGVSMGPSPGLTGVAESPESQGRRRDDRSAFVETIEDEQAPTIPTAKSHREQSRVPSPPIQDHGPARTESGIQPNWTNYEPPAQQAKSTRTAHISDRDPPAPAHHHTPAHTAVQPPEYLNPKPRSRTSDKPLSVTSQHHHEVEASPTLLNESVRAGTETATHRVSMAPTTASNVKRMVAESKFHDEALCQLLDAARLNLIGDEAKKALQRAARARVIELREMREGADEKIEMPALTPTKKEKRSKSKERHRRPSGQTERIEPTTPPAWAQEIIGRLQQFENRFAELEKAKTAAAEDGVTPPSQDIAGDLIDDLIFQDFPSSGISPHGIPAIGVHGFPQGLSTELLEALNWGKGPPRGSEGNTTPQGAYIRTIPPSERVAGTQQAGFPQGLSTELLEALGWGMGPPQGSEGNTTPQGAYIRTITPSERVAGTQQAGDMLSWGSEVELPQPGDTVPPPRAPPTINILAPTESNVGGRSSARVPSGQARSDIRTPRQVDVEIIEERLTQAPGTNPILERELPPVPPSESIRSNPTPVKEKSPLRQSAQQTPLKTTVEMDAPDQGPETPREVSQKVPMLHNTPIALQDRASTIHEKVVVTDPINPPLPSPSPWDLVTQRLYSWALVWEEETFVRALEGISLGRQVEEFPLTVYTMMTFKRNLSRLMTNIPKLTCDKLFVPPNMADAINKAVHAKRFSDAQQILEELWYPFGFDAPPRIIVALARHRNELDNWTAHRYDLVKGQLTSYSVSHEEKTLLDGRPFMWWHAIRQAWPQHQIPHPDNLRQRVERIKTDPEKRHDNSLVAVNMSRNLLLGWRPERETDLVKLRELIWMEVKRLLKRKRQGTLIVSMDSGDHVYDI